MIFFSDPETAARAGFKIVDYDLERQAYIVEKESKRCCIRARCNAYLAVFAEAS